jgi:hypothetical protein
MKIKFDPNQTHQSLALESVYNVFEGQELNKTMFSMPTIQHSDTSTGDLYSNQAEMGYANRLKLLPEEVLGNIRQIQLKNGLKQSDGELKSLDFTVEMETGTGKTYVYLRSVFEMNKLYGFTKFIIVVPSIAIKEGVLKSLQMTEDHFRGLYDNTPFDYFTYNSKDLSKVRSFATNDYIQIMVINIDAFRRSFSESHNNEIEKKYWSVNVNQVIKSNMALCFLAFMVAACGGNSSSTPPVISPPPTDDGGSGGNSGPVRLADIEFGKGATASGQINLLLDIYQPSESCATNRPTVLFVHGGSFKTGDKYTTLFESMAEATNKKDINFVSINYRLAGDDAVLKPEFQVIADETVAAFPDADPVIINAAVAAIEDTVSALNWMQTNCTTILLRHEPIGLLGFISGLLHSFERGLYA